MFKTQHLAIAFNICYWIFVGSVVLGRRARKRKEVKEELIKFFESCAYSEATPAGWIIVDPRGGPETGYQIKDRVRQQMTVWSYTPGVVTGVTGVVGMSGIVHILPAQVPGVFYDPGPVFFGGDLIEDTIVLEFDGTVNEKALDMILGEPAEEDHEIVGLKAFFKDDDDV